MPINIYLADSFEKLEWLCEEVWDLPTQIDVLEAWLGYKGKDLDSNRYISINLKTKK